MRDSCTNQQPELIKHIQLLHVHLTIRLYL